MKKNIIKLLVVSILLTIISLTTVLLLGKTYDVKFLLSNDHNPEYKVVLDNESGEVEVIDEKIVNNKYVVKVKGKKPGRVFINLDDGSSLENKLLYVHKSMIITDNTIFGRCTGSEIIPISFLLILFYSLFLLIKEYKISIKENLYQYKNIAYLGIILFLSFFALSIFLSIFNYQGLSGTINDIINSASGVSFILFPIAFITFILVTISNIKLIRREGVSLRNFLALLLGIVICVSTLLPDFLYRLLMKSQSINIYNLDGPGPYIYNFVEALVYFSISYLECILIGTIIIAIKSVKKKLEYNKDYIIILGCKINKEGGLPPLLRGRVDKAIEFRNKQLEETGKDLLFIPSGGKGNDEVMAEGDAIKKYLLEHGIKEKNIIVENKSRDTYQNIKYSYKLIKKKNANICFSTTNYHVLRAGLIATEQNIKMEGIGSKTKAYYWINAFIREFIGTVYREKKKHIVVFGFINFILVVMIIITYITNNV